MASSTPDDTTEQPSAVFTPLSTSLQRAFTLGPLSGFALILLATGVLVDWGAAGFLASVAAGTFVGGGKLMILAGTVERAPVGHWGLAALVVYIDLSTSLIVMAGIHYLYRLPGAGRRIVAARESGWRVLRRHPWMHRLTWLSLAGFVAVPFNGTGAFVGAVIGRLLGLSRLGTVTATGSGSLVGSTALALAGGIWEERINALAARPLLGLAAVVGVLSLTTLGSRWLVRGSERRERAE